MCWPDVRLPRPRSPGRPLSLGACLLSSTCRVPPPKHRVLPQLELYLHSQRPSCFRVTASTSPPSLLLDPGGSLDLSVHFLGYHLPFPLTGDRPRFTPRVRQQIVNGHLTGVG